MIYSPKPHLYWPRERSRFPVEGEAVATGHRGEILQGTLPTEGGYMTGVISNPCPHSFARARVRLDRHVPLQVFPPEKVKALRTAELVLGHFGLGDLGGTVELTTSARIGGGEGSSTVDCTATARAVLKALRLSMADDQLGRIIVEAEGASDGTMFSPARAVIWGSRTGKVLRMLDGALPTNLQLSFEFGTRFRVNTLSLSLPDYTPPELGDLQVLAAMVNRAVREQSVGMLGTAATGSALLNDRYHPKPRLSEALRVAEEVRAAGLVVAHTGSLGALMFDPATRDLDRRLAEASDGLDALGYSSLDVYTVSPREEEE